MMGARPLAHGGWFDYPDIKAYYYYSYLKGIYIEQDNKSRVPLHLPTALGD
jgi:hypothetical protein